MSCFDIECGRPEVWEWWADVIISEAESKCETIMEDAQKGAYEVRGRARRLREGKPGMMFESGIERYYNEILPAYDEHLEMDAWTEDWASTHDE